MKNKWQRFNLIASGLIFIASIIIFGIVFFSKMTGIPPSLFGYTFHLVVSDSMTPSIEVGDFVLAKKADINEIKEGDIVVFKTPDPKLKDIIILHQVIEVKNIDGKISLITSGTKLGANPDQYPVTEIYGKYVAKSSGVGAVLMFFSNPINLIFIIILSILIYIIFKLTKNTIKIIIEERKKEKNEL